MIVIPISIPSTAQQRARIELQTSRTKPPVPKLTVEQILARHVEALGGLAAALKVTSLIGRGTFEFPEAGKKGKLEFAAKAPNKTVTTFDVPDVGDGSRRVRRSAFNGQFSWTATISMQNSDPELIGKSETHSASELAATKRESDFYSDYKLKELFPQMLLKGVVKVEDRDAYVIEATPADGTPVRFYFDVRTGLRVRTDSTSISEGRTVKRELYYDDYRMVGNIKIAFSQSVISTNEAENIIYKFDSIRINVLIPDKTFNPPWK